MECRPPHNQCGVLVEVRLGLHRQPWFSLAFFTTGPSKESRFAKKIRFSDVNVTSKASFALFWVVLVSD
jgi:hypothetical protein